MLTASVRVVIAGPEAAGPLSGMAEGGTQSLEHLRRDRDTLIRRSSAVS